MSIVPPPYLFNHSLIEQSPITDKYYLMLADHTLLDLIKEAIKSILIFNVPLQELPIIHLQKENYIIYDNTLITATDIRQLVKYEFLQTAKLQKNFLDMSYAFLEKQKHGFSDMRESNDGWSVSWNKYKGKDVDDSYKKSYGVIGNLLCNNYNTFSQSIKQVIRLLQHLHRETLIPNIDTEQMQDHIMLMVTHQFFIFSNSLDLNKVLPIMPQLQKHQFVYSSDYGVELRKSMAIYNQETLYDLIRPKKQSRSNSIQKFTVQKQSKNQLKQLMKELFLKQFRDNQIIQPLMFDQNGQFKFFGQDNDDQDEYDQQQIEDGSKKEEITIIPIIQQKDIKQQKVKIIQKQIINTPKPIITQQKQTIKIQQNINIKIQNPKININATTNITIHPTVNPITNINTNLNINSNLNQNLNIHPNLMQNINKASLTKKIEIEKQLSNQIPFQEKPLKGQRVLLGRKTGKHIVFDDYPELFTQKKKSNIQKQKKKPQLGSSIWVQKQDLKTEKSDKVQISTKKIIVNSATSGTTLQAKVTSLTISADNPDKLSKDISLLKSRGISNSQILQQLAKDYAYNQENTQQKEKIKHIQTEEIDNENEKEQTKKKKKKNKKKKNKKGEQCVQDLLKLKTQTQNISKQQEASKQTIQAKIQTKSDLLTQQQKALFTYLQCLQIDQTNRIECKIDQQILQKWREQLKTLKNSFAK